MGGRARWLMAFSAVALVGTSARGLDAPLLLDSYRVLPNFGSFVQTGGIAGVRNEYPVEGNFDFATTWDYDFDDPRLSIQRIAWFSEPDLRAPLGEMLPAFIDIDDLLNLEGLRGEWVPQPLAFTPFEVFRFEGLANDSDAASPLEQSLVELFAVRLGPWMYLRGETIPRPWFSDYFEYELRALARSGDWPDWNDDGVINAVDYATMRDGGTPMTEESIADWQSAYGELAPDLEVFEAAIASALSQQGAAVPEPASALMAAIVVTLGLRNRRSGYRL
ncbi:MAG: hypothetical protein AAF266_12775 [Planctomycetota bacterium]